MAISGYRMSGLDVIGKGHGHEAIYYFMKEIDMATDHISSRFCQSNWCSNEVTLVILE